MNKRIIQILTVVFAIALATILLAESKTQEGVWEIGPRTLPPSGGVSDVMHESLANTPAPDVTEFQTRFQTPQAWEAFVKERDVPALAGARALAEALNVKVSADKMGGVRVHRVTPSEVDDDHRKHLFVYIHGGAWVFNAGEAGTSEAVLIAARLKIPVVSIDYRMPPQHPAPAATDDVVAVWKALLKERSSASMAMGGTSAGGNITLSSVHCIKQFGLPVPGALYLGTPCVDLDMIGDSRFLNEGVDRILPAWKNVPHDAGLMYAGKFDLKHPFVSPIYGDFADFPPSYLISGTRDLLLSDAVRGHRALRRAGVDADLHIYEGQSHGDYAFVMNLPESAEHYAELNAFLLKHLSKPIAPAATLPARARSIDTNPYMGAPVELTKAPNGAIARKDLLDRITDFAWLKPTIEEPAEGIYVFGGYAVAPIAIIETDEGLIAFDTGDAKHDGEILLKAIRTVSDKPIKAIIYGHSHTVHGAGIFAEGKKDIMIIGKPGLNERVKQDLASSGIPAFYPEIGPYLMGRAVTQFNGYMPDKGPDAWVAPIHIGPPGSTFIPVNTPVEDGQVMTVLGVKMQFFTKYGSDDKYHTTVWLPDRKILFTTMLWSSPPQLYSLRGDLFRDPGEWIAGLRFNMDLKPDLLVSAASRPIVGAEKIQQTLQDYMDGAMFVRDQSLRGILHGLGPDDLRHFVKFPKYLDEAPINLQSYGEISSYSPAIFYHAVGWYDNDAATLKPLAPADEARRLVPLMGGRKKVIKAARDALEKREYAWAAKLANQLYLIDNQDMVARQLKADALRQMAYVSTGANDRAHLISQVLALEGKLNIARLVPPPAASMIASPATFVDYFRVRIDPEKSDKTNSFIRFNFADGTSAGLHIRRAVAEFVPAPDRYQRKPDITLAMSAETWIELYLSKARPEDLIKNGDIKVTGDPAEAARLINLFDRYKPEKAVVIPPAFLNHPR